jgi:hypothetical protein
MIVLDRVIFAILLLGKEEGGSVLRIKRADVVSCKIFLYRFLEDFSLVWWQGVDLIRAFLGGIRFKVDFVIESRAMRRKFIK